MRKYIHLICMMAAFQLPVFGFAQQQPIGVFDSGTGGLTCLS